MTEHFWWEWRRTQSEHWLATRKEVSRTNTKLFAARQQVKRLQERLGLTRKTKERRNAARDRRWQQGVAQAQAELDEKYKLDCNLGLNGHRPSRWEAAITFAYTVSKELPPHYRLTDDSLNPLLEREAANLILTAVKRLQIAHTKRD